MSESDTELNNPENDVDRLSGWDHTNDDIILDKDTMDCFLKFKAQQDLKKTRAEKKRLTKKGLPDKRAESSSKNVSKAREKVKEYLALSKSVVDDGDTDEDYIEVCVKKNPKKTKKFLTTRLLTGSSALTDGIVPVNAKIVPDTPVREIPVRSEPKVEPRVEDSAIYKLMFGQSHTTDLRAQLLRKK